ncbi:MAG: hypothetical protein KDK36_16695, partial [Leptospiraceae bacterium]|nr:hypothetical protein [Leptospiraceae bacterium]
MSGNSKKYTSIESVAKRLRQLITDNSPGTADYFLIFAHNGTGKTRLSMAFNDAGKKKRNRQMRAGDTAGSPLSSQVIQGDTLYFNAYTEDLFHWDNDLENDLEPKLIINSSSKFFKGFRELSLERNIYNYLERYVNFNFKID